MTKRIEILVAKYFSDNLSSSELEELLAWIENEKNNPLFSQYIAINFSMEQLKSQSHKNNDELWARIQEKTKTPIRRLKLWHYTAAASVLLMIGIATFMQFNKNQDQNNIIVDTQINVGTIGTDRAVLTLENGTNIELGDGKNYSSDHVESAGDQISYTKQDGTEVVYNYLTVPRSGQFYIELSDETKVWLNSESKLKYPTAFINGEDRVVELLYGEAYFDVSPSTQHQGSKFKVKTNEQELEVLGTEFNIKAYSNDQGIYTTLVEGGVKVSNGNDTKTIRPGEQSTLINNASAFNISVVNVYDQISWKDGIFSFEGATLLEITKVISRWYDVEFEFENLELRQEQFIGRFQKQQALANILEGIKNTGYIKGYEIKGQNIVLK